VPKAEGKNQSQEKAAAGTARAFKDREAAYENDGAGLQQSQNHLRLGACRDAEGNERQHAKEPDGPGACRPHNVVASAGREEVERRLSRRERGGDIEDSRETEEPGLKPEWRATARYRLRRRGRGSAIIRFSGCRIRGQLTFFPFRVQCS